MSVQVLEQIEQEIFEIRITGKLTKDDYQRFLPEIEQRIEQEGKIRLLVILENFEGFEAGALWEDLKFDFKHFNDIDRLALVGKKDWHKHLATFCKPFTMAEVRYYEPHEEDTARQWLQG